MKLKLVVASMSVLGLISCPLFAAAHSKHKTHHKRVHHRQHCCPKPCFRQATVGNTMVAVPAPCVQPQPCLELPRVDCTMLMLDAMTQNWGRGHAMPDWFQRIGINGGINFDAHFGNRDAGFTTENYTRFSVNDVYLNATALVNDWTRAFVSISYNNASPDDENFFVLSARHYPGVYSNVYRIDDLSLEQGYITFGNFDCSPFFVQVGKMFQDYGRYTIHPLTRTLVQSLTETLRTSAKVGFMQNGFHGSAYVFENPAVRVTNSPSSTFPFFETIDHRSEVVWGASLGYDQVCNCFGFDLGVGYLSNMIGVNDVTRAVTIFHDPFGFGVIGDRTFRNRVGSVAVYADVNSGPFTLGARYATALTSFNELDLSTVFGDFRTGGAKPRALDLTAGYGWNCWDRGQNIYVSYQTTRDAVNLFLPRDRWEAGYGVDIFRNATLTFVVDHDKDYDRSDRSVGFRNFGPTGNTYNLFGIRAAVRFG